MNHKQDLDDFEKKIKELTDKLNRLPGEVEKMIAKLDDSTIKSRLLEMNEELRNHKGDKKKLNNLVNKAKSMLKDGE